MMQEMPTYAILFPPTAKSLVTMIRWTFASLFFALAAGLVGFGGVESEFTGTARILFALFLLIFVVMLTKVISEGKKVL
jgi:uncharacterized membrane protein YtjA (UPF0391 family)